HITIGRSAAPLAGDGTSEFRGRAVATAQRAVDTDEIGVAKLADRGRAVLLAAAPEVVAGEATEYGGAARMGAFALQRQKDLFDRVTHSRISSLPAPVCRSASPSAMATLIATLSERRLGLIGITSRASAAATT